MKTVKGVCWKWTVIPTLMNAIVIGSEWTSGDEWKLCIVLGGSRIFAVIGEEGAPDDVD